MKTIQILCISVLFFLTSTSMADDSECILLHKSVSSGDTAIESGNIYFYGKQESRVPDVFSYIADKHCAFRFIQRETSSGKEGYFPTEPVSIQQSDKELNEDQRRNEYYQSRVKLAGTPHDWLYGVCSEGTFFFSPRGMIRIIQKHKPSLIERNTLGTMQNGTNK